MKFAVVGEVRTAEHTLRGLLRSGIKPVVVIGTDVNAAQKRGAMEPSYYCDLRGLADAAGVPYVALAEASRLGDALAAANADVAWITGWPHMVPRAIVENTLCIGMHPTALPKRRGGAPLNWLLIDGERESAVSLLRLARGVDSGEIVAQRGFSIGPDDYVSDVLERVYAVTEDLVAETAPDVAAGKKKFAVQDESAATFTRRRQPEDGVIQWRDSAVRVRNLVRAISKPFPGAFTFIGGRRLTVWRADIPEGFRAPVDAAVGTILPSDSGGVLVCTRDNALRITEAQFEGGDTLAGPALSAAFDPLQTRLFTSTKD